MNSTPDSPACTMRDTALPPPPAHAHHLHTGPAAQLFLTEHRAGAWLTIGHRPSSFSTIRPSARLLEYGSHRLTMRVKAPPPAPPFRPDDAWGVEHQPEGRGARGLSSGRPGRRRRRAPGRMGRSEIYRNLGHAVSAAPRRSAPVPEFSNFSSGALLNSSHAGGKALRRAAPDVGRIGGPSRAGGGRPRSPPRWSRLRRPCPRARSASGASPFPPRGSASQPHGDVVGEVIAADADHGGVPRRALEDRQVGSAAADVEQRHAELALVGRQHRFGRGELADDMSTTARPARSRRPRGSAWRWRRRSRCGRSLPGGRRSCPPARRCRPARRRRSPAAARAGPRGRGSDTARAASSARRTSSRVIFGFFRPRPRAPAVETPDCGSARRRCTTNLDARHELGLFHRLLDGIDGGFQPHHDAALQAASTRPCRCR